ncbi:serine/threonine protein kinase [Streptomyces sp. SM18]|uniref:serine/threonine protein kinase n=1 Tax=Streptomyces sp. SM18 TaxID=1736046 RepID=UPI0015E7F34D|nr:serine/threonine protein kinase [Streptomyces sp. SM18]
MEHLRGDDPARIGPYTVLGRFGTGHAPGPPREPRYVARSADGDRTVLLCLPRTGADPARWAVEARHARDLSVPGFLPVDEVGGTAAAPWYAVPYVPALPLPDALAACRGPLPEPFVRVMGRGLAASLRAAHARGVVHAGLSPAAVLITPGGVRLAGFGAVRGAGEDGRHRGDVPGLDHSALPPEQMTGGRPRPLGDVYGIGAVLSYASTGHTVPQREEIPDGLRAVISACLARDPAQRPDAARLEALLAAVPAPAPVPVSVPAPASATADGPWSGPAVHAAPGVSHVPGGRPATVIDAPFAAALPAPVAVALARVAAAVLAAGPAGPAPAPYDRPPLAPDALD